jgi:type I restriction enzyme R subunit
MSGSASDHTGWQVHIRSKQEREEMAARFKDENDPLKLVIVRDMWLTGFDCPSLHTMYIDKPMSGHNLMQAIARVNRVYKDKPGGLIVDYIGIADALKRALSDYTNSGGEGDLTRTQEQAVAIMLEKYGIVRDMLHKYNYKALLHTDAKARLIGLALAVDFVLSLPDGKKRFMQVVSELSKAFALAVPHPETIAIRDEVGLFQELRAMLAKSDTTSGDGNGKSPDEINAAIKQLVSRAVASTEVVDIFKAVGMDKPDISILSEEFLEEVRNLPHKNLAFELLKKLLNDEIRIRSRKNIVQGRAFSEMLEEAVNKYQKRALTSAEVIQELIKLAKEMKKAQSRGDDLGLNEEEMAFYDALSQNNSAVEVLGDQNLCIIAHELLEKVRQNVTIDWSLRENARAKIRILVKRILRRYGYPPDLERAATELVLEQTEVLCNEWV